MIDRLLLALLWLLHFLPLSVLAPLGKGIGAVLYAVVKSRRHVALTNLAIAFPERTEAQRRQIAREHFGWLGRSLLERSLLWYASPKRLSRLIQVDGDVAAANAEPRPVMWLVPHFVGLDVAAAGAQLNLDRHGVTVYQRQSNAVWEEALRRGRLRFGRAEVFARSDTAKPLIKAIRRGKDFFNLPDMDFGARDAAFVPFFGVPAATLLAPSRIARALNMPVRPIVAELLPGGRGYRVRFGERLPGFPSDDPMADTLALNRWIEAEVRRNPAQYLWVHKRFKTRPEGEASLY
ncbi:MAG: lipid biosynthesis acyltransferase [Rhizobacter sp.]|nr:lipid biosynthesis acyltransferase [Rhizobacter sp.]